MARLFTAEFLRALERLRFSPRRAVDGRHRAELRSRRSGSSLEFAEHRNYTPGDDPRSLDWSAYARLDRLFVKLFHDEEAISVEILVDASESMRCPVEGGGRSRWDQARLLAGAFAYVALAGQHEVKVGFFGESLGSSLGPLRGRAKFHDVLAFLDGAVASRGRTDLDASLREAAGKLRRRAVAVVISDFLDPAGYERAVKRLLHRGCDVAVVRVFDPAEDGRELEGDLLVVDAETGVELAVGGTDERVVTDEFAEGLRQWCRREGLAYHAASCSVEPGVMLVELERSGALRR